MKQPSCGIGLALILLGSTLYSFAGTVRVYPAPAGEELCARYRVRVDDREVPVYVAKVAPEKPELRWKAMDDKARSAEFFETASFAYFDMDGAVTVTVTCSDEVHSAKLLPTSLAPKLTISGQVVSFSLAEPRPVTLEINGKWTGALHLFANPPEVDAPRPGDPGVIYFGPGIHEITSDSVRWGVFKIPIQRGPAI